MYGEELQVLKELITEEGIDSGRLFKKAGLEFENPPTKKPFSLGTTVPSEDVGRPSAEQSPVQNQAASPCQEKDNPWAD